MQDNEQLRQLRIKEDVEVSDSLNTLYPKCGRFLRLFEELKGMLSFGIKVQLQRHIDKSYAKRCSNFFVVAM